MGVTVRRVSSVGFACALCWDRRVLPFRLHVRARAARRDVRRAVPEFLQVQLFVAVGLEVRGDS